MLRLAVRAAAVALITLAIGCGESEGPIDAEVVVPPDAKADGTLPGGTYLNIDPYLDELFTLTLNDDGTFSRQETRADCLRGICTPQSGTYKFTRSTTTPSTFIRFSDEQGIAIDRYVYELQPLGIRLRLDSGSTWFYLRSADSQPPSTPPSPPPGTVTPSSCSGAACAPELGTGDPSSVTLTTIARKNDGLATPRDLAFNPRRPDELWVVNRDDDSMLIVHDASTTRRRAEHRVDGYALHFMDQPSSISFGADETTFGLPGTFGTCQESRNDYNGMGPGNDFMGPTLWSSDLSVFAKQNPQGLGSHIDMLHNSPLCVGIEHQEKNVYWAFGGLDRAIVKYDFQRDHGIGTDDHLDGISHRYVAGQLGYEPGVPSHLAYDHATATLYIADTGNSRLTSLDTRSGRVSYRMPDPEGRSQFYEMAGARLRDVVPASSGQLQQPSGLELHGGLLYVSDHATGVISAFTTDGQLVKSLDTGLAGGLAGMAFGPDGKLYLVDMANHRVLRIDPR